MTDNMRDRIADAIAKSVEENPRGDVYDMADAVIRELGLQEQTILPTAPGAVLGGGIELTPSEFDEFLRLAREP